jgi:acetyltransferase-like isoleucine patch superfamily enzyme
MIKEVFFRLLQHCLSFFIFDLPGLSKMKTILFKTFASIPLSSYVSYDSFLVNAHCRKKAFINIGENTSIENGCYIDYSGGINIGDNIWISENAFVTTHDHIVTSRELKKNQSTVFTGLTIGDDAWLGEGCKILGGVEVIGKGAVIGAGAIVTKDVPDYAIVVGSPARVVKYRG